MPVHSKVIACVCLLTLVLPTLSARPQTVPIIDYFPSLSTGNSWNYTADARFAPSGPFSAFSLSQATPTNATIHGSSTTRITRSSSVPGDVGDAQYFSIEADGLRLHREDLHLTQSNFELFTSPAHVTPAIITVGQTYHFGFSYNGQAPGANWAGSTTGTLKVLGFENITVPAGTFNALKVDYDTSWSESGNDGSPFSGSGTTNATWWMVQGLGLAQISIINTDSYNEPTSYVEYLTKLTSANVSLQGDFDGNSIIDLSDIDDLYANLGGNANTYDLTADGNVDSADVTKWIEVIKRTIPADTDLDGDVDDTDLGTAFANYSGPLAPGSPLTWASGNTDGDQDVDDTDLGTAFANYTGPLSPLANVPEPSVAALLMIGGLLAVSRRRG